MADLLLKHLDYRITQYHYLISLYALEPSVEQLYDLVSYAKKHKAIDEYHESEQAYLKYLQSLNKWAIKRNLDDIHTEYAHLFIGPKKLIAPPFESVYSSKKKLMHQDATKAVAAYYRNANIRIEARDNLPADFIAYELEFMYILAHRLKASYVAKDLALFNKLLAFQLSFIKLHLANWIPNFTSDISNNTTSELYRVSSTYLNYFIQTDLEMLESLTQED